MPELPEVETVVQGLTPDLTNQKIKTIVLNRNDLRIPFPKNMSVLYNKKITAVKRRAKYILVHFEDQNILVIHLGMSGSISIVQRDEEYEARKHDHMIVELIDGKRIVYNDPRRFGMVFITNENELETHKAFHHLGPEPLGNKFSAVYLKDILKNKKTSIKQALLDQRTVVGVGNIYACESLFQASINPEIQAYKLNEAKLEELVRQIRDVLKRAIKAGGSTLKDYRKADGELGYFQHSFKVYDQAGKACPDCDCDISKTGGIKRIVQSGRSTFYCPKKQK